MVLQETPPAKSGQIQIEVCIFKGIMSVQLSRDDSAETTRTEGGSETQNLFRSGNWSKGEVTRASALGWWRGWGQLLHGPSNHHSHLCWNYDQLLAAQPGILITLFELLLPALIRIIKSNTARLGPAPPVGAALLLTQPRGGPAGVAAASGAIKGRGRSPPRPLLGVRCRRQHDGHRGSGRAEAAPRAPRGSDRVGMRGRKLQLRAPPRCCPRPPPPSPSLLGPAGAKSWARGGGRAGGAALLGPPPAPSILFPVLCFLQPGQGAGAGSARSPRPRGAGRQRQNHLKRCQRSCEPPSASSPQPPALRKHCF